MVTLLTEEDIASLLSMDDAVDVIERTFERLGEGEDVNRPRDRVRSPGLRLQLMGGACPALGVSGAKIYNTTREGTRFLVALFDQETGRPRGLIEADELGRLRTGAASGVATRHLARDDATRVGIIGTGHQAEGQLEAVAAVRELETVKAFSRTPEHREAFAETMADRIRTDVVPVDDAAAAVADVDVLITITSSSEPVFEDEHLDDGVHVNAAGSNSIARQELPTRTVVGADRIVVDSEAQARAEAGDLVTAMEIGLVSWEAVRELGDVVAGYAPGRESSEDTTVFESLGLAVQDVSLGALALERAEEQGVGRDVPLFEE